MKALTKDEVSKKIKSFKEKIDVDLAKGVTQDVAIKELLAFIKSNPQSPEDLCKEMGDELYKVVEKSFYVYRDLAGNKSLFYSGENGMSLENAIVVNKLPRQRKIEEILNNPSDPLHSKVTACVLSQMFEEKQAGHDIQLDDDFFNILFSSFCEGLISREEKSQETDLQFAKLWVRPEHLEKLSDNHKIALAYIKKFFAKNRPGIYMQFAWALIENNPIQIFTMNSSNILTVLLGYLPTKAGYFILKVDHDSCDNLRRAWPPTAAPQLVVPSKPLKPPSLKPPSLASSPVSFTANPKAFARLHLGLSTSRPRPKSYRPGTWEHFFQEFFDEKIRECIKIIIDKFKEKEWSPDNISKQIITERSCSAYICSLLEDAEKSVVVDKVELKKFITLIAEKISPHAVPEDKVKLINSEFCMTNMKDRAQAIVDELVMYDYLDNHAHQIQGLLNQTNLNTEKLLNIVKEMQTLTNSFQGVNNELFEFMSVKLCGLSAIFEPAPGPAQSSAPITQNAEPPNSHSNLYDDDDEEEQEEEKQEEEKQEAHEPEEDEDDNEEDDDELIRISTRTSARQH